MEEHSFRRLIRIAEGEELSPHLAPKYEQVLNALADGPKTAAELGVSRRTLLALFRGGHVEFEGENALSPNTRWSLPSEEEPITEDEMMSRREVRAPQKRNTDGSDSPLSGKRRRGLSPKAAKALFSK